MEPSEIRAEDNRLHRLFTKFNIQWITVSISAIALTVSLLSLVTASLIAWVAVVNSTEARIRADYQDDKITELTLDVEYWTLLDTTLRAELKAQGYQLSEPPKQEKE